MLFLPPTKGAAQLNQDIFALIANRFKPGYFIEIGANDGFTLSNTWYLEENFGWSGILVEANPRYAASLALRKNSKVVNKAISGEAGVAQFADAGLYSGLSEALDDRHAKHTLGAPRITVECTTFQDLLSETQPPAVIDFLSIDVEGVELEVMAQFVSSGYRARCGCIETNMRPDDTLEMKNLLSASDYCIAWDGQTDSNVFFIDPIICSENKVAVNGNCT